MVSRWEAGEQGDVIALRGVFFYWGGGGEGSLSAEAVVAAQ